MDRRIQSHLGKLLTLLLSTAAPLTNVQAQDFGKVGAVNPEAMGTPPGSTPRTLSVGSNIVVKERIKTSASGSTQILFPDQSTLNIGANSDLVIEEYFYNPAEKRGSMVASATKGVLRYVGGQISHTTGATITTPSAVLGVRGGIVTIMLPLPPRLAALDPALAGLTGELVISHFGSITLKNNVSQTTLQPGYATVIGSADQPIPVPFRLSDATLQLIMQTMTSHRGQHGGVTNWGANNNVVLPPGFGTTILNDPAHPPGTDPLGYTTIFGAGAGAAKNKAQSKQVPSYP
jgi:hypothetical protein